MFEECYLKSLYNIYKDWEYILNLSNFVSIQYTYSDKSPKSLLQQDVVSLVISILDSTENPY